MPFDRSGPDIRVHPAGPIVGDVRPPGSKSLTNRFLICTALADGESVLRGASLSDDARAMTGGLGQLGIPCEINPARSEIRVTGHHGNLPDDEADINVGHAGTAMRFLTALASLGLGDYRLDGSPRMRQRPIGALVGALQSLGAQIGYEQTPGCPPLTMRARGLTGGNVVFTTPPSSQFISALLMVAPHAKQDVMICIEGDLPSRPYVDMTIDTMRALGVELLEADGRRFVIPAYQRYQPGNHPIEPDASGATYLWTAAAITGGRVRVEGLTRHSRQGDVRFVDVLAQMGCRVTEEESAIVAEAPRSGRLQGITVDLNDMPDTAQTLAVAALFADGPTEIRNVASLRVKETDRIAALATELSRLGAKVDTREDGLTIHPPRQLAPASIDTYDDHRMAMSFALAGLVADGVTIRNADVVSKSFPDYFNTLESLATGTA